MAEAWWHVMQSTLFTDEEKLLISTRLAKRINKDGYLIVKSSETRSQLENKNIAQQKLEEAVAKALIQPKKRKPTRPSKASVQKRLESKKRDAAKKKTDAVTGTNNENMLAFPYPFQRIIRLCDSHTCSWYNTF